MSPTVLLFTFSLTAMMLLALRPVATLVGLVDLPGGRKTHSLPTPMIGGLGIYLGTLAICMLSPVVMADYQFLLAIAGFVLLVGILDDLFEIRASLRIACHAAAALAMATLAGVKLDSLGSLLYLGPVELGLLAVPVTMFATVGVINAVNMSDGLDGLSGGLVVIALVFLSIAALVAGHSAMLSFNQILIVAVLAFLAFNFRMLWKKNALIYLGDAGSTLLGFILAWLVIAATQGTDAFIAPVYALWFLAVPLMDTVSLMIKRPLRGLSPFTPGRDHLHHRLLNAGFTPRQTVLGMHAAAVLFGSIGLSGHIAGVREGTMFLLFMSLFAIYLVATRHPVALANTHHTQPRR
ncbi:undecaprenyl/decaprenyl-phosphate alpha-N-acetylglucosaminyl 1-phosphate transferase [Pseudohongiella sp.]|uniref:Uncharacterized protein n=1 Tax=marine sediment metagenome TaxID=412755 RepID=A0A0F9Z3W9_9ZZZZ|nr:undecaprenyl/decaprenyl-phosphate alpha-N-acetylglucosaminyl 1-phosphate transferase [Pseudohongiella sp.]